MRGVGDRDHEVALGGRLEREAPPQLAADLVHRRAPEPRVRAREVDELEDAERVAFGPPEPRGDDASLVDAHQLAGLDVPQERRADDVERAGLGGDAEPVRQAADRERTQAVGVARREQAALVHHDERERALERGEHVDQGRLEVLRWVPGEDRRDQIRVGGGRAPGADPLGELERVHEVAVVPQRERPLAIRLERGLGVLPRGRAGRRIAVVPDPEVSAERRERRLVEHLGDEPQLLEHQDVLAVGDGHPGRLLPPVLLGEEREVGQPRDIVAGCPHPEDAALLLGTLGTQLGPMLAPDLRASRDVHPARSLGIASSYAAAISATVASNSPSNTTPGPPVSPSG
jgi:hypothetical protein